MAAAVKSQLFFGFQAAAALLVLLIALAVETQMAQAQDCQAQISSANACVCHSCFLLPLTQAQTAAMHSVQFNMTASAALIGWSLTFLHSAISLPSLVRN
ncbi:hypothetical protein HS088_TW16G00140 [Tripterygium wilfordii]|uniref:Uncharacterized protein n=1 Tax=Tripterygium wilfordii TaxID=458696 RepID=A0A7J7CI23_TRIWF|nr:hypothetical protein HS088_TW16G00140 [Tripterygium wilfordii]